jgi:hypothetical protein
MFHTTRLFFISKISCCLLLFVSISAFSQKDNKHKIKIKHLVSFAPILSLYKSDPHFTTDTKGKAGYCISYKTEFVTGKKLNYVAGLDFVDQRFSFKGYFAAPMHTYIYDKTFAYTHSLNIQEIQVPLGIRFSFFEKPVNNYVPYFTGGIKFRYLLKTTTIIRDDSTKTNVYTGTKPSSISFESNIPSAKINSCFQAGFGIQRNYEELNSAMFFEITFNYGISRFQYVGNTNSNNLGIRNAFVAFAFGWKL